MKTAIIASIIWLLFTISVNFILPPTVQYIAMVFCGALFLLVPTVNHIRMLFSIRRHNREIVDGVAAQQKSAVLRREKKVALDMCVVAIILLVSMTPAFSMKSFELQYPRVHTIAVPWSLTMALMTSSINPVFYLVRNTNLRNAVKSMINL